MKDYRQSRIEGEPYIPEHHVRHITDGDYETCTESAVDMLPSHRQHYFKIQLKQKYVITRIILHTTNVPDACKIIGIKQHMI